MNEMKEFRTEFKLTQQQAADALGYKSIRAIQYMEAGQSKITGMTLKAMEHYRRRR